MDARAGETIHMLQRIKIRPYFGLENKTSVLQGIDTVFFQSSNTQTFASDEARAAFRERWLGRYLTNDPGWAYVALTDDGDVAGYLVGSLDDPARTARFFDIPYFSLFEDLTRNFPAHLHVNLAPAHRGGGIGAALVERFAIDASKAGSPGVHVVTSRGARNVGFYNRNGFVERGAAGEGAREVVFLARTL
jgi:GNAT superfamily N-acetyltransferase